MSKWRLVQKCETPAEAEMLCDVMKDYYDLEHMELRANGGRVELLAVSVGGISLTGKARLVRLFNKTLRACRVSYAKHGHCPLDVLQLAVAATTDDVAKRAFADRLKEMGLDELAGQLTAETKSVCLHCLHDADEHDEYGVCLVPSCKCLGWEER